MKPIDDIPSKLLCKVNDVELKVDNDTDEVFVKISLVLDTVEVRTPIPNAIHERTKYFTKVLTASDSSTHGGFSILKRHAIECFPPLDMSQPTPSQEIVAKDLNGYEWRFKHIYRGTPKRHLFTTGWSTFATAKKLVAGDSFVFIRGENGESLVGIRRASHQQGNIPSSIITKENIYNGVTASVWNAIKNEDVITVFYKPRSSQFIISLEKFVDAMNKKFDVHSRFTMPFESADFTELRYSGKIVGKKDFSSHWKDSEWRSLEVKWDEAASIPRPDKVSPWEIEHYASPSNILQSALLKNKRSHDSNETGSKLWTHTLTRGQEIGQSSMTSSISVRQRNATDDSKSPSSWLMNHSVPTIPKVNSNDQMVVHVKEKMTTDATASYRLFGVDLMAEDHMEPNGSHQKAIDFKILEEKKLDQIQNLTSPKEIKGKQIISTGSRTKVFMQDRGIGRVVDLTLLDGYNHLINELEKLFDLKDELHMNNHWEIVFKDNEGDVMLVGDDPWPEFCKMVKKIFICSKEKVKIMELAGNKSPESG
ncbi:unnamed protein product [Microthlaspi erraticum]|uniref:Auxin response factor n=1 Tax=Microthlaspi erraticum TaxID=1685480 RepID=A0A6D2JR09_9BRAS|nr:unnamed protein product [Microthlaspi erraticum]